MKEGKPKDSGGVWVTLEAKGQLQFKVLSVHTATFGMEKPHYCREEQLLTFLRKLKIAECKNCIASNISGPEWRILPNSAVLLAGDFNIDPVRGGAQFTSTTITDRNRFKWVVDFSKPLSKEFENGDSDLNALVALRGSNKPTTSYISIVFRNLSLDHVLASQKLVDAEKTQCTVLDGSGEKNYALSEDWWTSDDHSTQEGMDHYAIACNIVFRDPSFDLALDSSNLTAKQGDSVNTTLTITPQNGFSGTVNLSLVQQDGSPAPSGLTISPTQVSVSGQTTKSLEIHISSSVEAKTYSLRLVGQSGSSTAYADFNLTVNEEDGGWVERNSGTSVKLIDTIYGGDLFVAVGWNGTVLTSPDGISWSMHDSGTNNHLHDVTYGPNQYIAVGQDGTILTSLDGISWEKQDSATSAWLSGSIYASGKFVVIGDYGTILTSTDGTNWSKQNSGTYRWLVGIAYASDRNLFVVVGLSGTILTSTDGEHWTARNSNTTYNLEGVAYGDGRFVAVGANGTILTSSDGISWSPQDSGTDSDLFDPTYGNDQFVVVGDNGTILSWRPK